MESRAAELFGKESSLFVLSGTMANLLAATSWCRRRGEEAFVGNRTHVFLHSQACLPQLAGVQAHNLPTDMDNGTFDLDVLRERAVPDEEDFHYSRAALVYAENSHNESGGRVLPEEWVKQVRRAYEAISLTIIFTIISIFLSCCPSAAAPRSPPTSTAPASSTPPFRPAARSPRWRRGSHPCPCA